MFDDYLSMSGFRLTSLDPGTASGETTSAPTTFVSVPLGLTGVEHVGGQDQDAVLGHSPSPVAGQSAAGVLICFRPAKRADSNQSRPMSRHSAKAR